MTRKRGAGAIGAPQSSNQGVSIRTKVEGINAIEEKTAALLKEVKTFTRRRKRKRIPKHGKGKSEEEGKNSQAIDAEKKHANSILENYKDYDDNKLSDLQIQIGVDDNSINEEEKDKDNDEVCKSKLETNATTTINAKPNTEESSSDTGEFLKLISQERTNTFTEDALDLEDDFWQADTMLEAKNLRSKSKTKNNKKISRKRRKWRKKRRHEKKKERLSPKHASNESENDGDNDDADVDDDDDNNDDNENDSDSENENKAEKNDEAEIKIEALDRGKEVEKSEVKNSSIGKDKEEVLDHELRLEEVEREKEREMLAKRLEAAKDEKAMKDLDFEYESKKVEETIRDFIPKLDLTPQEYNTQEALIRKVKEKENLELQLDKEVEEKKKQRGIRKKREVAAMVIQRVLRGHLDRNFVRAKKQQSNEKTVHKENIWKEVHDPNTGDTWYYNLSTGESQWDIPEELGDRRKVNKDEYSVEIGSSTATTSVNSALTTLHEVIDIPNQEDFDKYRPISVSTNENSEFGAKSVSSGTDAESLLSRPMTVIGSQSSNSERNVDAPRPSTTSVNPVVTSFGQSRPMTSISGNRNLGSRSSDFSTESKRVIFPPLSPGAKTRESISEEAEIKNGHETKEINKPISFPPVKTSDSNTDKNSDDEYKQSIYDEYAHAEVDEDGIPYGKATLYTSPQESDSDDYVSSSEDSVSSKTSQNQDEIQTRQYGKTAKTKALGNKDSLRNNGNEDSKTKKVAVDGTGGSVTDFFDNDDNFFLPDGSTDVTLKTTIRHALQQNKYDSVSSLLAAIAKEKEESKKKRKKNKPSLDTNNLDFLEESRKTVGFSGQRPQMVAQMRVSKKRQEKLMSIKNNQIDTAPDADIDLKAGVPPIYQVSYPGVRAQEIALNELESTSGEQREEKESSNNITERLAESKKEICFLCWSSGDDMVKSCDVHGKSKEQQSKEGKGSVLTCGNWTIATLQRKYRSEEIQEIFEKSNPSLRWNLHRKKFVTVVESKHTVYRNVYEILDSFNRRVKNKMKVYFWFKSVMCDIKIGRVGGVKAKKKGGLYRARDTIMNNQWIKKFKQTVYLLEPKAPQTEDDIMLKGNFNLESGYKVLHRSTSGPSRNIKFVMAPTAKPFELTRPFYLTDFDPPVYGRVPAPSYAFSADNDAAHDATTGEGSGKGSAENVFMPVEMLGSWFERLASYTARTATIKALKEIRDQVPEVAKLRTKHAPPTTNKFATFFRRELTTKEEIAKEHGLPPKCAILSQFVTTTVSAQYGKFIVTSKSSLAPKKKKYERFADDEGFVDYSYTFKAAPPPERVSLGRTYSSLNSALNTRRPPGITASAYVFEDAENIGDEHAQKLYHGENRHIQTAETDYVGFRTTTPLIGLKCDVVFDTVEFVPSIEVAVPNSAGIRGAVTTKAGIDYPFCIPSSRGLSALDHFHLLVSSDSTFNSPCCFTTLGRQDPGLFSIEKNSTSDLGILEMRVYRSFGYFQTPHIEEFKTVEGVPYWYNKKTGETYWESPLFDMDQPDEEDEDRPLVEDPLKPLTKSAKKKFSTTIGAKRKPVSELKMRQHMLTDYEEQEEKKVKPDQGEFAREMAKAEAKKKAQELRIRDRIGQASVLKGRAPLEEASQLSTCDNEEGVKINQKKKKKKRKKEKDKNEKKRRKEEEEEEVEEKEKDNVYHDYGLERPRTAESRIESPKTAGTKDEDRIANPLLDQDQLISTISTALEKMMEKQGSDESAKNSASSNEILKLGLGLGLGLAMRQQQTQQSEKTISTKSQEEEETVSLQDSDSESDSDSDVEETDSESYDSEVLLVATPRQTSPDANNISATPDEVEDGEEDGMPIPEDPLTHQPAGEGTTWQAPGAMEAKLKGKLLKGKVALPEGFIKSVHEAHTAKQHADYLPALPNLNTSKSVGVVKPRQILKDWISTSFDPWSNGKDLYATSFIPSLYIDEEGHDHAVGDFADEAGIQAQRKEIAEKNKMQEEMEKVFSYCRHGKYAEVEEFFDDLDCIVPIDAKDPLGNTLLSIAAQNGNKRIAKICLRKGADINTQNLNGQSILHYCIAYGFEDLAEYFLSKGADDSLVNADGLTCYEGLRLDDVNAL